MPPTTTLDATKKLLPRVRAHKGNVPSLPQTKYCSLCPAKFTRTTHLNRHLRSRTSWLLSQESRNSDGLLACRYERTTASLQSMPKLRIYAQ
ncbi:hypothetical protein C8F04DRAFT_236706 [Mycena alexandri]|uniref:C2H2-type domain-containing protein n=1 Tax=Mycena alexandri TaxID=1745969 RepID=A0AAD6S822_9AGAR|nr:hypothetical protein C8F04DRAFT_236706 [Mycena alexandri]